MCVYIVCMCLGARAVCGCAYSTSVRDLRYLVKESINKEFMTLIRFLFAFKTLLA